MPLEPVTPLSWVAPGIDRERVSLAKRRCPLESDLGDSTEAQNPQPSSDIPFAPSIDLDSYKAKERFDQVAEALVREKPKTPEPAPTPLSLSRSVENFSVPDDACIKMINRTHLITHTVDVLLDLYT